LRVYAELFRRPDFNSTERGDHEGFELVIESLGCCQEGCVIVDRDERRGNDVGDGASAVWASLNNSSIGHEQSGRWAAAVAWALLLF